MLFLFPGNRKGDGEDVRGEYGESSQVLLHEMREEHAQAEKRSAKIQVGCGEAGKIEKTHFHSSTVSFRLPIPGTRNANTPSQKLYIIIVITIIVMTIKNRFVDRWDELEYLEKEYGGRGFKFVSVTGRRRVGKTRLIEEFIRGKKRALYFFVPEMNDAEIRLSLAEKMHEAFNMNFIGTPSWEKILGGVFKASEKSRTILVLDEFQRFLKINKSVPSVLQGAVDIYGKKSKLFLVVMGSSIGMMHRMFDHTAALYGRRTGQLDIQPLQPRYIGDWFPGMPLEKMIEIYSVFGGTPRYLEEVDPKKTVMKNIEDKILSKKSTLYSEPEVLIKTELSDSATYFNILKLIAEGKTRPREIAGPLTIKQTSLKYFLNVLENDMGLIKREVIATERSDRSKRAVYKISDNFFRFWFRYVYRYRSDIEIENTDPVAEKIESELNAFVGRSFEDICRNIFLAYKKLPFRPSAAGRWWGFRRENGERKEMEIDLVALNGQTKEILFGECKWKENVNAEKIFADLKEKSRFVKWNEGTRKEHYVVFAKSFRKKSRVPNLTLFDLSDIEKMIIDK